MSIRSGRVIHKQNKPDSLYRTKNIKQGRKEKWPDEHKE